MVLLPADHSAGNRPDHENPAVDASAPSAVVRVGHHFLRGGWPARALAAEPESNALGDGDAGDSAGAQGPAGPLQEGSAEVAAGDDETVSRARRESAGGLHSDADSDAGPLRRLVRPR